MQPASCRSSRTQAAALAVVLLALVGCSGGGGESNDDDADDDPQVSEELSGGESEVLGDADEGIEGVKAIRVADPAHTESIVDYDLRPPAGGIHNPEWWNCGFYDESIPDENVVHDLEHGAVWLAYASGLSADDVEVIHDLVRAEDKVVASLYPDLDEGEAVVATAWARQLRLESVDDERLAEFVEQYRDGSQAPEAGATCVESPLGDPIP